MNVNLPENFANLFRFKSFKVNIKILEIKDNLTVIEFKGQKQSVPFVLDRAKKYIGIVEKSRLTIVEKSPENIYYNEKDSCLKDFFENFIFCSNEISDLFDKLFNLSYQRSKETDDRKNLFFNDENGNYLFIFDMLFFGGDSKILLKIDKKNNIDLIIYSARMNDANKISEFKTKLVNVITKNNNNIKISILENRSDFLNSVSILTKGLDIIA